MFTSAANGPKQFPTPQGKRVVRSKEGLVEKDKKALCCGILYYPTFLGNPASDPRDSCNILIGRK